MTDAPPRDFLRSPAADALTLVLFAAIGVGLGELFWLMPRATRLLAASLVALAGPLACAIERGRERPFSWPQALAAGAVAAATYALLAAWALGDDWSLPVGFGLVLVGGALLARAGARLDRGEAAWRAVVRAGPPDGGSPLADAIAARALPSPWRWLALPLDLPVRAALLAAIRLYQLTFSRLMPPACRFEPTCSRYGWDAVWRHGALRGTLLTALRLVRCSPLSSGGHDPVPPDPHAPGCPNHKVDSRRAEVSS